MPDTRNPDPKKPETAPAKEHVLLSWILILGIVGATGLGAFLFAE